MQSSRTLLTIAIPTYNRSSFLDELLASLFDQCKDDQRVELLISDNASNDNTPEIIKNYADRGLKVNYLRNTSNLGPDANCLQCFERATGKYVWLIGDDDVVVVGAIATIMAYLQAANYSLVYISSYSFEGTSIPNKLELSYASTIALDARQFSRAIHVNMTFISGIITNKEYLGGLDEIRLSDLIGTNLVQLGWIYSALNKFKRGLIIKDRLIGMRINNTGGYKLSQIFGSNLQAVTVQRLNDNVVAYSILDGTLMRFLPAALLKLRESPNHFQVEGNSALILRPAFGDNYRYWFFVFPVIRWPYHLAKIWFLVIRVINKIDKLSGSYLMR